MPLRLVLVKSTYAVADDQVCQVCVDGKRLCITHSGVLPEAQAYGPYHRRTGFLGDGDSIAGARFAGPSHKPIDQEDLKRKLHGHVPRRAWCD